MLSIGQLELSLQAGRVRPLYLTSRDHLWVEMLLEEYERHVGLQRRILERRLAGPLPGHVPRRRFRVVQAVLDELFPAVTDRGVSPVQLRRFLFLEAARLRAEGRDWRIQALNAASEEFGLSAGQVAAGLFADLPPYRRIAPPERLPTVEEVVSRANLLMAQSLVARSHRLVVELDSQVEAVVRTAKLLRLICSVQAAGRSGGSHPAVGPGPPTLGPLHPFRRAVRLELSGPLSLFRHTVKYGRALASLLPVVVAAPRWRMEADCELRGRRYRYRVGHWEEVLEPVSLPRRFDSRIEERFLKDFQKLAPDWDVLREPGVLEARGHFFFPDFGLAAPWAPGRIVLVEIVGFWTAAYLERKLRSLSAVGRQPFILCFDERLGLDGEAWPGSVALCPFRRRVDARRVLAVAEGLLGGGRRGSPVLRGPDGEDSLGEGL